MAVHSGKAAEIHAVRGGIVTPNFCLQGPVSTGIFYELEMIPGERLEIGSDSLQKIFRQIGFAADTRYPVAHQIALRGDGSWKITHEVMALIDTRQAIQGDIALSTDLLLSIRRASPTVTKSTEPALEFLGKGLKFPFTFQRSSGGAQISTATSSDHAHIHESIRQILGTKKGERFMRPEFGTRLHELVFEPNDRLLYGLIRHEVIEALEEWEPRIIISDVIVSPDDANDHLVLVNIGYRLISSQIEGNCVYPFWRELE